MEKKTTKFVPKPKWEGLYKGMWAMNGNEPLDKLMYSISGLVVLSAPVKALIENGVIAILQASNQCSSASKRVSYINEVRKNIKENLTTYNIFSPYFITMIDHALVKGQAWEAQNRKKWNKDNQ